MPLDGAEVPQLILVQPFGLAFLVVDFNGPAMAPNAGDARGLPHQAVADVEDGIVRQIRLTMVDDQALFTEAVDVVRLTIAVVGFLFTLVGDRDALENRFTAVGNRRQVFLLESAGEFLERFLAALQRDLITIG